MSLNWPVFSTTKLYDFLGTNVLSADDRCLVMHKLLSAGSDLVALQSFWLDDYKFDEAVVRWFRAYLWSWIENNQDFLVSDGLSVSSFLSSNPNTEQNIKTMCEDSEYSVYPLATHAFQINIDIHKVVNDELKVDRFGDYSNVQHDTLSVLLARGHFSLLLSATIFDDSSEAESTTNAETGNASGWVSATPRKRRGRGRHTREYLWMSAAKRIKAKIDGGDSSIFVYDIFTVRV